MLSKCKCGHSVKGTFNNGWYHFKHCGHPWRKEAYNKGKYKDSTSGTKVGAVAGVLGAAAHYINPIGGLLVGALFGSAFNSSDKIKCPKCNTGYAYPTGRNGRLGNKQYQCSERNCKKYSYK
ncbi:MAG: hypothetical protein ABI091_06655 [Ferruginibacter sp.]